MNVNGKATNVSLLQWKLKVFVRLYAGLKDFSNFSMPINCYTQSFSNVLANTKKGKEKEKQKMKD